MNLQHNDNVFAFITTSASDYVSRHADDSIMQTCLQPQ